MGTTITIFEAIVVSTVSLLRYDKIFDTVCYKPEQKYLDET